MQKSGTGVLSRARLRHAHACAQLTTISCTSRVYLFLAQLGQLAFAAAPRHDLLFPGLVDALFLRFQCFLVKHCKVGHRQSSLGALPEAPGQRLEPIPAHIPFRTLSHNTREMGQQMPLGRSGALGQITTVRGQSSSKLASLHMAQRNSSAAKESLCREAVLIALSIVL